MKRPSFLAPRKVAMARSRVSRYSTSFQDSTLAEQAWGRSQGRGHRWAVIGAVVGTLLALVFFAPAAWLAQAVSQASNGRLVLSDASGTVWNGSAVPVLTGGPGSVDASSLPGRLVWAVDWRWQSSPEGGPGWVVELTHACCLNGSQAIVLQPRWGRLTVQVGAPTKAPPAMSSDTWFGQWPSQWLSGLGTPWNTLQLGGATRLSFTGATLAWAQGRWNFQGLAQIDSLGVSSRVSPLPVLGHYRLTLTNNPADPFSTLLSVSTVEGALQLNGSGQWDASGMRFRGDARAQPADEAVLSNLLNIIGRREGSRSVISIG
jgi:general secretion pathway protein N